MPGRLEAIHITDGPAAPMRALERATLHAGVGIEGDRYATSDGGRPILRDFVHRGGLRASILADGEIAVGDSVEEL